jgi:hypothetical protein
MSRWTFVIDSISVFAVEHRIVCRPDPDGLLEYALGYVCSTMYYERHHELFAADGPGIVVADFLSVTRIRDRADLPDNVEDNTAARLLSMEAWSIDRPRGFGHAESALALSGENLRNYLSRARALWAVRAQALRTTR